MQQTLTVGNIHFTLIRCARKTLAINVENDGSVNVRAPEGAPEHLILKAIADRHDSLWETVQKHQQGLRPVVFENARSVRYRGENWRLRLEDRTGVLFVRDGHWIHVPASDPRRHLIEAFTQRIREHLQGPMEDTARELRFPLTGVQVRDVTGWVKVSRRGLVSVDWRAAMLAPFALRYLLAVAACKASGKQADLWRLCPDARNAVTWLKEHGRSCDLTELSPE